MLNSDMETYNSLASLTEAESVENMELSTALNLGETLDELI